MTLSPDGLHVSDYQYELPPGRVAKYPVPVRDASKLLVVERSMDALSPGEDNFPEFRHLQCRDMVELFEPGDVLVVNESRVLPARLLGRKSTGAPSEVLLVRPSDDSGDPYVWEALVRPGSKLKPGRTVVVAPDLTVEILDSAPESGRLVRLVSDLTPEAVINKHGHMPLPPYIGRSDEPMDRERYQTVYARKPGSIAAPTAGLHFTKDLLTRLQEHGVRRVAVTLHVGVGTFRPVAVDDPAEHELHEEHYHISKEAADAINTSIMAGRRIWAIGTTVVRTLESAVEEGGLVRPGSGTTQLFIRPSFNFQIVNCLLTNFHLPRSTLLMLVAAFAGYGNTMAAYQQAIAFGYRFYSYGDAMAVVDHH